MRTFFYGGIALFVIMLLATSIYAQVSGLHNPYQNTAQAVEKPKRTGTVTYVKGSPQAMIVECKRLAGSAILWNAPSNKRKKENCQLLMLRGLLVLNGHAGNITAEEMEALESYVRQ